MHLCSARRFVRRAQCYDVPVAELVRGKTDLMLVRDCRTRAWSCPAHALSHALTLSRSHALTLSRTPDARVHRDISVL
eukprot:6194830-Pleurochrysis_carterae.AAC.1